MEESAHLFVKLCHKIKLISLKERQNYALWMTNSNLLSSRISNDSELRRERPVGYWCSVNCVVQEKTTTTLISDPPEGSFIFNLPVFPSIKRTLENQVLGFLGSSVVRNPPAKCRRTKVRYPVWEDPMCRRHLSLFTTTTEAHVP